MRKLQFSRWDLNLDTETALPLALKCDGAHRSYNVCMRSKPICVFVAFVDDKSLTNDKAADCGMEDLNPLAAPSSPKLDFTTVSAFSSAPSQSPPTSVASLNLSKGSGNAEADSKSPTSSKSKSFLSSPRRSRTSSPQKRLRDEPCASSPTQKKAR